MIYIKYTGVILSLAVSMVAYGQKAERSLIHKGNRMYADSLFVDAEVNYRKALSVNPQSVISMYNLGNSLLLQNKPQDAMEQYDSASNLSKDKSSLAQIHHNRGVIYQGQQDYAKAIEAYKHALRNNPHDDETRYNLALAQKLLKDQQQKEQQQKEDQQDQKQDKQKEQEKQQQQPPKQQPKQPESGDNSKEQMSKENAEQLLQSVIQDEKNTQEKLKKQPVIQKKQLEKDW